MIERKSAKFLFFEPVLLRQVQMQTYKMHGYKNEI